MKPKTEPEIFEAEWLALLEQHEHTVPKNAKTIDDFARRWNCSRNAARKRLTDWGLRDKLNMVIAGKKVFYIPKAS